MRAKQWHQGILIGILLLVIFWLVSLIWGLVDKVHIAVLQAREARLQHQRLEARKAILQANGVAIETERRRNADIRTGFGGASLV